jgi:PAS domain S-box-containing protein
LWFFLVLLFLVLAVWIFVQTSAGQNWLTRQVTARLSKDLGTRVEIKHVDFSLFNKMHLEGVIVEDKHHDTLLYASDLKVRITDWFFIKKNIELKYIGLENATVYLHRTDSVWNHQFIIDRFFSSSDTGSSEKGGIELTLKNVDLKNVIIRQKDEWVGHDMLVSLGSLNLDAKDINFSKKVITINSLSLVDPVFSEYNYASRRLPAVSKTVFPKPVDSLLKWNTAGWVVQLDKLEIKNGLIKEDKQSDIVLPYFDGRHVEFGSINGTFTNVRWEKDTIIAHVDLQSKERSGFEVKKLEANLKMTPQEMTFNDLYLEANNSVIRNFYRMSYDDIDDMSDYIHKVRMQADFTDSEIDSDDIAYFAPEMKTWKKKISLKGKVRGTVDDIIGREMLIQAGKNTLLNGDVSLTGLPDINKTFIDFKANDFRTTYEDAVAIAPAIRHVTSPDLRKLQFIRFNGSFTGFIRDITERKQAEETLRHTEELYRRAITAADAVPYLRDYKSDSFVFIGEAIQQLTGYSAGEMTPHLWDSMVQETITRGEAAGLSLEEAIRRTRRGEIKHWQSDCVITMRDGTKRWVADSSIEMVNDRRETTGSIGILMDITERRQIEEQLRQLQKMESIGQLAAGVAHDFNNILAVIQGHTDMVLGGMVAGNEAEESLKQVAAAAKRASNLTRQLLVFSRKQEIQPQDLNLNEVVNGMNNLLGRLLGAQVTLQFVPAANLPAVYGDAGMMEQVLLNLAVNARDAMPGGGRLTVTTTARRIDETQAQRNPEARAGQFIRLSVNDTGSGIAPEILSRIFEPFFTTKEVSKGTGLGLATVYGIVKQHQGWIEVESEVGRGTTFNVFLPASSGAATSPAEEIPTAAARGRGETILIAEDEPALRRLAARVLRNLGYEVLEAASGVEALQVWEERGKKVDLLLTDMVMPDGLTGRELAKQMKTRESGLKVIYTSGYSPEAGETAFVFREGINFLQKPYPSNKLAKAIRDCLDA